MAPYFVIYLTLYFVTCLDHMMQEGTFLREILALQAGPFIRETVAKHDMLI
jgi:hypothetical protein